MSISPLLNLSGSYLQSLVSPTLSAAGSAVGSALSASGLSGLSSAGPQDNSSLSPFTQLLSTLQQLQQSNPAQYQQVAQQIATNLQSAAKTATSDGNTTAAGELNQLATDFTNASQTGQLPNVQDLAQAVGGAHHHHHGGGHHHAGSSTDASNSNSSASSDSSQSSLTQLLNSLGTNNQSDQFNAQSIILNTLSSAGVL